MHVPVLLHEALDRLSIKPGGIYVDATFGRGGHSYHILTALSNDGRLVAIDADADALEAAREPVFSSPKFKLLRANFAEVKELLASLEIHAVDGLLFDLGVSSPQFDVPSRGFSYRLDGPLDMRLDQRQTKTAQSVVNRLNESALKALIWQYGEEPHAGAIARAIIAARANGPITTTSALAEIIKNAVPGAYRRQGHPARKTFQALRIYVNDELVNLQTALESALDLLNVGGRIVVISFHSLEDRIVKQTFARVANPKQDRRLPVIVAKRQYRLINKKVIIPTDAEINSNPRARSAKMRVIERTV